MAQTIYQNNDVEITVDRVDSCEAKVECNGCDLIWIESPKIEEFKDELSSLLDKYRI